MEDRDLNQSDLVAPESLSAKVMGISPVGARRKKFTAVPANSNSNNQWSRHLRDTITDNYLNTYMSAPSHLRNMGEQFFPNWNEDAHHIGEMIGRSPAHGAAIMAHLSPSNEAELNRIQAIQLADQLRRTGDDPAWNDAVQGASMHVSAAKSAKQRARSASGRDKDRLLALSAHHVEQATKARSALGFGGTPLNGIGNRELANAVTAYHSSDPLETLLDANGARMKVYHFGHNIDDFEHYDVPTIDTHAHDAGLGRVDIPYKVNRGLESQGRAEGFQDTMRDAHRKYTEQTGSNVPLSGFMGGLWFPHLQRKVMFNDAANRARKATDTKLARIQSKPGNQLWIPGRGEHADIRPSFGKIQTR